MSSTANTNADESINSQSTADTDDNETTGPSRAQACQIICRGENAECNRLKNLLMLNDLVGHVLQQGTAVDKFEFLSTFGDKQYNHFLTATNTSDTTPKARREAEESSTQLNLEGEADDVDTRSGTMDDDAAKTAVGTLINGLEEHCQEVDYKVGRLDLSPLAEIPVPTSRLLALDGQTLDSVQGAPNLGAIEILIELIKKRIPHLYQLLVKRAGSNTDAEYIVSIRLAVFDEEYGIATEDDLSAHLNPGTEYTYDIAKPFRDELMTSNFQLPVTQFRRVVRDNRTGRYQMNGQPEYLIDHPFPIEQLMTFREYNNLLSGSFTADARYKRHFSSYAHIPVNGDAIGQIGCIIPAYFEHSPWERTAVSKGPKFDASYIPSSSTTPQRYDGPIEAETQSESPDNSTSEAHKALINFIVKYLVQQGYTILAVDQTTIDLDLNDPDPTAESFFDGESQSDIVAEKDGQITIFEAEINDSNPAAFLKNLERAAHFGYQVVVVTQEASELQLKINQASCPFNTDANDSSKYGTRLYNFSEERLETDDLIYLLPRGTTETKWYLSHDGKLTLGDKLAVGDPEAPLHTLSYSTPRCRKEGGEYVVVASSGEHLATYQSLQALTTAFTPIKLPFIPTQITYTENVEFRYKDTSNNQLVRYYPTPTWARKYRTQTGRRHKASRDAFIEAHTTTADGETLFIPDVRKKHTPWHAAQTKLDGPTQSWFGREIGLSFKSSDTESRDRELLDRTWVYPPGLDPKFPDFAEP